MPKVMVVLIASGVLVAPGAATWADAPRVAQATGPATGAMPGKVVAGSVKVRGTVDAIDKGRGPSP